MSQFFAHTSTFKDILFWIKKQLFTYLSPLEAGSVHLVKVVLVNSAQLVFLMV